MKVELFNPDTRIQFLREYIISKNTANGLTEIDKPAQEALVYLTSLNQEMAFIQAMSMQMIPHGGVS